MEYIDYLNCIVGIPNSILKHYGLKEFNNSLKMLDEHLKNNNPKNIILIICDGMGYDFLENNLNKKDFLRKNLKSIISSVFPSTTASATTSIITGLYPNQHCWLGWDNYIKPLNKVVTMFLNKEKDTNNYIAGENICHKYFGYKTIFDLINSNTKVKATYLSPFDGIKYKSFDDMCNKIKKICNNEKQNFIYAYYENPDSIIHKTGLESKEAKRNLKIINQKLEKLVNELNNTLIIITADHGLIKNEYIYLEDYDDIFNCLKHNTSIDSRASMIFVKANCINKFKELFLKNFEKDFLLFSKKEIIDKKIFGLGQNHKMFNSCLGDYIAVGIKNKAIKYKRNGPELKATHSGLTKSECLVPLIIINKNSK
ncbi:MAG: alkaline phosphatase family protein [Bacilli bacterium]|nr:alkaline phosphatase family protein [Bacilli bacterium]